MGGFSVTTAAGVLTLEEHPYLGRPAGFISTFFWSDVRDVVVPRSVCCLR